MTNPNDTSAIILGADRASSLAHYPHARRIGNLLYLSGCSSRRADNTHAGVTIHADGTVKKDIEAQTEAVIKNVAHILHEAGLALENLVDMTTFLVDMNDFAGYNRAYNRHFTKDDGPARTTVAVHQLPHPNLLIEMKAVAYFPE